VAVGWEALVLEMGCSAEDGGEGVGGLTCATSFLPLMPARIWTIPQHPQASTHTPAQGEEQHEKPYIYIKCAVAAKANRPLTS
jgi:hypothetical protein